MRRLATCALALAAGLGLGSAAFMSAGAQTGDGWVTLLDSSKMGEWDRVGESNWRMEDGAVVADKRSGEGPAHLVSKTPYKNFEMVVEFWASDDANSGIFLRCQNPKQITDRSCYEVNIFDQRPDPTYGTGGIVHFSEVNPMPKAGGKWNTFEISAKGPGHQREDERAEDRRTAQRVVDRGPVHAPAWRRRDQVPQSRDQAALRRTNSVGVR